jgi:hypothetical protein
MARHWKRWSRRQKVFFLTAILGVAALTAAWAVNRPDPEAATVPAEVAAEEVANLVAPLPPPAQVFIQATNAFPEHGNVLVTVRLSKEDLDRKTAEGTRDFVAIGAGDMQVILRDDGLGGDAKPGDGDFTGLGTVDDADLQARFDNDSRELAGRGAKQSIVFMGRAAVAVGNPRAFDLEGFREGKAVPFEPAVAFIQPEDSASSAGVTATFMPSHGRLRPTTAAGAAAVVLGTNLFQDRVLMIRDLAVVGDLARTWNPCTGAGNPNGVWTFNHLMTQMANQAASGIDPAIFVENFFAHWTNPALVINSHPVAPRGAVNPLIITPWPKRADGHIDLAQSPFRLLAIVPRLDLRTTTNGSGGYGANVNGNFLDAGEARFVFGLVDKSGGGCFQSPFALIFEYRVPKCECKKVKGWAQSWVELFNFVPGTADYNGRLHRLTEQFVRANANPTRPNGSALGQLRSNEISLAAPWELREFQLTQFPFSFLNETTSADTARNLLSPPTPAPPPFNNTAVFDAWILTQVAPNLTALQMFQNPIPGVPLFFNGQNFLDANPRTPNTNFFWRVTNGLVPALSPGGGNNTTNWGRHRASLAACNGCHGRESRPAFTVAPFVHVDPSTPFGLPATLSEFLTGVNNLPDPQEPAGLPNRNFDDLARREVDIVQVANMTCFGFHAVNLALVQDSLRTGGKLPADLFQGIVAMPASMRVPVAVDDFRRNVIFEVH